MPFVLAALAIASAAERRWPLRRRTERALPRFVANAVMGALALGWDAAVGSRLLRFRKRRAPLEMVADVLLLDYTLWWWHRWNHEVAPLWRFHAIHHADADMDSSTALRFALGERMLSSVYRALQVLLVQPSELSYRVWQTMLFASILFHHSNIRLPQRIDDRVARHLVAPRMHGIHHANVIAWSLMNYASLLTWWDEVHGKLLLDVPQEEIVIGAPSADHHR